MTLPNIEPEIRVGLVASKDVKISPIGNWDMEVGDGFTDYIPTEKNSFMEISGVIFGKDFHWESLQKRKYNGKIRVYEQGQQDGFQILNILSLENYIESVVVSEMHQDAPKEFIKAHAIMSRTWALRKIMNFGGGHTDTRLRSSKRIVTWEESDSHSYFDVCSDDHCQRYQGINEVNPSVKKVLEECRGIVLVDESDNSPADTRFSKCCGGETEIFSSCWADTDFKYLRHIEDPYCNPDYLCAEERGKLLDTILKSYDRGTNYYYWEEYVSRNLIRENLQKYHGVSIGAITDIKPTAYGASRRITRLLVEGTDGSVEIGKELAIRRLLSSSHLYSSMFEISERDAMGFKISGKGWGHGVGLCQIGAAVMAHEGKKADEILNFYFPGTKLTRIY